VILNQIPYFSDIYIPFPSHANMDHVTNHMMLKWVSFP